MKPSLILVLFLFFSLQARAQISNNDRPKLLVGVVVDQMRYDYLDRFWDRFGEGGFKRLVNEGYSFKNNHYNYMPTSTGPGHTSVWTGTSPMNHGIISNNWYDKFQDKKVYCVGDNSVRSVGTSTNAGKMSPHRLISTTVTDQNRLATELRGKTIGVSIKDRASILPAGHMANAAYWFQGGDEGKFITSSYYMNELPQWVKDFNGSDPVRPYLKTWNTLYDIDTYKESGKDLTNFENGFKGKQTATFPYDIKKLSKKNGNYSMVPQTPFGNDLIFDFAIAAIEGESLGEDGDTDILAVSFSSTDKVGHNFGVNSKEVEDTYLRLDQNIAELLDYLDTKVGKGNYTMFLTADHAGGNVGAYLRSVRIPPVDYFDSGGFEEALMDYINKEFGREDLIRNISSNQLFFDYDGLDKAGIDAEDLERKLARFIIRQNNIFRVFTRGQMQNSRFSDGIGYVVQNGFNPKRSGDVIFVTDPGSGRSKGSSHGSVFNDDTHVPLLFFGNGVKHGATFKRSEIIDIAPTVSALLGISFPNAATGNPLYVMLDK